MTTPPPTPFGSNRRPRTSKRAQRTAAEASGVFNAGLRPPTGHTDAPAPAEPTERRPRRDRTPAEPRPPSRWWLPVALCFTVAGACTALFVSLEVLGQPSDRRVVAAGVVAAVAGGIWASLGWEAWPKVHRLVAVALAVVLIGAFYAGTRSTVVIDGRPYLSFSTEARAYRLANELLADLDTMATYDELLAQDPAAARAGYDRFEPARVALEDISNKWTARLDGDLPGPQFRTVIEQVRAAAYWESRAMALRGDLVIQADAAKQAELATTRETFVNSFLASGTLLAEIADLYNLNLQPSGGDGPKE